MSEPDLDTPLSRTAASASVADALGIPAVRPYRKAVTGYTDEPGSDDDGQGAIVDPAGQLPAIWFQQMDSPRAQRNRIHLDITVTHDEAEPRVRAALAAGGRLVDDSFARSFWAVRTRKATRYASAPGPTATSGRTRQRRPASQSPRPATWFRSAAGTSLSAWTSETPRR